MLNAPSHRALTSLDALLSGLAPAIWAEVLADEGGQVLSAV